MEEHWEIQQRLLNSRGKWEDLGGGNRDQQRGVCKHCSDTLGEIKKDSQPHLSFWKDHKAHFHRIIFQTCEG